MCLRSWEGLSFIHSTGIYEGLMCATLDAGYNGEPVGHGLYMQESTVGVCSGGEERYIANHTVDLKNSRYEHWYDKKIKVL